MLVGEEATPNCKPVLQIGSGVIPPLIINNILNQKQMSDFQTVTIIDGNFTGKGNFSGYNAAGQRIHVPARQMENHGLTDRKQIKFPLYALVVEREFSSLDASGQPTGEKFKRAQTGSIFLNQDEMMTAANADDLLRLKTKSALASQAKSIGLTDAAINSLLSVAI